MQSAIDTSYEPFSREPEYLDLNRQFIESLEWDGCRQALDIACGTGTLTQHVLRAVQGRGPGGRVVGLDLSRESLGLAVEHFVSLGVLPARTAPGPVAFLEGSADCLPLRDRSVDAAVMGNAIHILPDRERLLREIARVLRPGGRFSFNSSFYAGTFAPGTERFYTEWMKEAVGYVRRKDAEQRRAGAGAIPRVKGQAAAAFSRPWASPEEYAALLERCGFAVQRTGQRTLWMTQRSFETVGAYAGLARVLMSGFPVPLACEALAASAAPALAAVQTTQVPRYWLEMTATRR